MTGISLQARFRGALLGLAVGDALGTTVEFSPPGTFVPVEDITGGGPFHLEAGQWTDDTSMGLCLAESLLERAGFDARDQMERYLRWRDTGYFSSTGRVFDFGNTVEAALNRFRKSGDPFSGSTDPKTAAGNGSLMRVAPVALFFSGDPDAAVRFAGESSRTTHGAPEAIDACRFFAHLLVLALSGAPKELILGGAHGLQLSPRVANVAQGSYRDKFRPRGMRRQPDEVRAAPYVVDTLEAALWAFYNSDDFRTGCLGAANLGDDADTVSAIYGQLAGAFYGEEGIPKAWRDIVVMKETIVGLADRLLSEGVTREAWNVGVI